MTTAPTRRERQRQATYDEIVEVSRRLLHDRRDVSIRAVAQEMGLTPPALYRYVDSHAELLQLVARSIFADIVAALAVARDAYSDDDPAAQIVACAAAFRTWALGHHPEFQLVFASQEAAELEDKREAQRAILSLEDCPSGQNGAQVFGAFFSEIFGRLWAKYHFPIPADEDLAPELLEVLRGAQGEVYPEEVTGPMGRPTPGMIWLFERCWARLYGTVTLEVFGCIHPGFTATGALFAATMLDLGRDLGIDAEWERLREVARAH
jgi:AcrR family transcriptional regulator